MAASKIPVPDLPPAQKDRFFGMLRSRVQRRRNGEDVKLWDETIEKVAAESLEEQRRRFYWLLNLGTSRIVSHTPPEAPDPSSAFPE